MSFRWIASSGAIFGLYDTMTKWDGIMRMFVVLSLKMENNACILIISYPQNNAIKATDL